MAVAAREYEKKRFVISPPKTIEGMIELKMHEKKLKQKDLAKIMGLEEQNCLRFSMASGVLMLAF